MNPMYHLSRGASHFCRLIAALTLGVMFAASASAAVVLTVESGKLTGATGILIGGTPYDVSFRDGTCISIFDGCDSTSDFGIQDGALARLASMALLEQVLLGAYDTDPSLTYGCPGSINNYFCIIYTPYSSDGSEFTSWRAVNDVAVTDYNSTVVGYDYLSAPNKLPINFDFAGLAQPQSNIVFARWSRASQVPEPSSLALLGLAGAALGLSQRRRRISAKKLVQ